LSIISETSTTFRLHGDELNPDEVTSLLGVQPSDSRKKGSFWHTPNGKPLIAQTGRWALKVERAAPGDISKQIRQLLARMTDDLGIWRDLTSRFEADVFCGLWLNRLNEGETLAPDVLLMLGQRNIKLEFDIYARADDGSEEANSPV
jgi:hypothetical protein